jgi:hypothetical protein
LAASLQFALAHREDDVQRLLLGHAPAGVDVREAVTQIEGWRTARHKLPTWAAYDDIVYPQRLAMEQCSSEATARYKASLVSRSSNLTDLTGGFGVDCAFMAPAFDEVTYVERNATLCAIAASNFATLRLHHIRTVNGEAHAVLEQLPLQDWIYLDPARRDTAGRKMVSLADCEPDVVALEPLLLRHARRVMVKCSPMLDISLALRQLASVQEVHVVSVQNECKELLLIMSTSQRVNKSTGQQVNGSTDGEQGSKSRLVIHAVNLQNDGSVESDFAFAPTEEQECQPTYADGVGRWLYEPNASLLKAGCFKMPAVRYGLQKLHRDTHLYTSNTLCADFQGRIFEVVGLSGFGKQELKELLGDVRKANLAVRNFPDSVEGLRRRLHLSEGGEDYLFATTTGSHKKLLVRCRKVQK